MSRPIQPTARYGGMKAVRGKRAAEAAKRAEQPQPAAAPEAVAPVPPTGINPDDAPPAISAQILGQGEAAENAGAANIAGKARAVYLGVEWSGPADRRNRSGKIAKTDV